MDNIASRVAALEARDEILSLKARYWRAIDAGDVPTVAACLADDAEIDFEGMPRFDTAEPFLETVRQAAAAGGAFHQHHGHNPDIVLTSPDTADGRWDIQYRGIVKDPPMLIRMSGVYTDRYRRRDGRWMITAMRMRQISFLAETVEDDGSTRIAASPGGNTPNSLVPENR